MREYLAQFLATIGNRLSTSHITIKDSQRTVFLPVAEIDYVESAANYSVVHAGGESHVLRETLTSLMERLPREEFVRVSRGAIVKAAFVAEVRHIGRRKRMAVLRNGKELEMTHSVVEIRQRIESR